MSTDSQNSGQLSSGLAVTSTEASGMVRYISGIEKVLELMKSPEIEETILLVDTAAATEVTPLLAKVAGIICRSGGLTSHLALVSREFGLACVMSAEIDDPEALEGRRVRITADGEIFGE